MDPAGGPATPGGGRSTGQGRRAVGRSTARNQPTGLGVAVLLGLAFLLAVGSAGAAGPADAQFQTEDNDTEAPTVGDLTAVSGTTLELAIEDDTDVAEDSINESAFEVVNGTLESVAAEEDGTDATVTLTLAAPVDTDVVAVEFTDDAAIADEAGNQLETSGVTRRASGMDTVPPQIEAFAVESAGGTAVNVTVRAHEPVGSVLVTVEGPRTVQLDAANFTASDDGTELRSTVDLPSAGDYRATLQRVTDEHDNTATAGQTVDVATEDRPPTAVAGIDFGASGGLTITVDASRSTAEDPIESISWDLGDGTEATGERVTHRYRPGNYTVTLTVTDEDGDVGTDDLVLNLQRDDADLETGGGDERVAFGSPGPPDGGSAIVDVAASADEPVRVARDGAPDVPIATGDGVAVEAMTVTTTTNARYALAIQTDGPTAVADVSGATDGSPIGALTVVHDVADEDIANVTIDVAVERTRVDDVADDPTDVGLFRYHNDSWQALETAQLEARNGSYRYRATSPGLSRFAVASDPNGLASDTNAENATDTPSPTATPTPTESPPESTIGVTNASVNRTEVDPDQAVEVSATVTNSGEDVAGYTAALSVDGRVVDAQTLTVPPDGTRPVSLAWTPNSTGSYELIVNETVAGTVSVGENGGIVSSVLGLSRFLPLGLVQTVLTYLGGVLVAVFLALKSVALFLGY